MFLQIPDSMCLPWYNFLYFVVVVSIPAPREAVSVGHSLAAPPRPPSRGGTGPGYAAAERCLCQNLFQASGQLRKVCHFDEILGYDYRTLKKGIHSVNLIYIQSNLTVRYYNSPTIQSDNILI